MAPVPRRKDFVAQMIASAFGMRHASDYFWFAHDAEEEHEEWHSIIPWSAGVTNQDRASDGILYQHWQDAGVAGHPPLSYKVDPMGWIHLRGVLEWDGSTGGFQNAFSVPASGVPGGTHMSSTFGLTVRTGNVWKSLLWGARGIETSPDGSGYTYFFLHDTSFGTVSRCPLNGLVFPMDPADG